MSRPWGRAPTVLQHSDRVFVKRVRGKGRGVFARQPIAAGDLIERVPVLLVPEQHVTAAWGAPALVRVAFYWDRSTLALALGYGSLYNHSYTPNARYDYGPGPTIAFIALHAIPAGSEITINYNGEPDDTSPVGFEVR